MPLDNDTSNIIFAFAGVVDDIRGYDVAFNAASNVGFRGTHVYHFGGDIDARECNKRCRDFFHRRTAA
jgi:hypothetical protein